ncbi:MAG: succinate dehydrogenase, cytochrome b556 subunit [Proteobacteria bacterium TMED261]|nr:MAG: succinate dehydrogenase, cytochrome b556 subunit [Proteobacteria bacterium TMED261]
MKTDRPVNINPLTDYGWPFTALVSITNRVLGIVLFAGMAFALYLLDMALSSEQGFAEASTLINGTPVKLAVLFLIFALTYHLVAGIKHLLLDFHIGDTFEAAQVGSGIVVASSILITGVIGVNLW